MIESTPRAITGDFGQLRAEREVARFRRALGPFVVAAEATRMAMTFTNATEPGNPIIFANDSFLALTGFACGEVIGQSFAFLMSRVAEPSSLVRIEAQFDEKTTETIEVECRRRDGSAFLVAVRINPVHDNVGNVVQHCVSFVDLSAHIERERKERNALHALYQHTPDFIATTQGADHMFTFANDAFQRLVGNRGMLGQRVVEAMPELAAQGLIALLDKVFATGKPFTGRGMGIDLACDAGPDCNRRFVDVIAQAIRSPEGLITGIFCEGHDMTDEKLAADQVAKLQADVIHLARVSAMGTIAATLAHELAQPLTVIANYAELCCTLIDADDDMPGALADGAHGVRDNVKHAGEIVRRLKSMMKRGTPERTPFDLQELVGETIDLVRVGRCNGVSLADRSIAGLIVDADRVQIQQVMVNLLKNGCEAASVRPGGRVAISSAIEGDRALVSVRDNGMGVAAGSVDSLFDWSDSTKPDGMGIGLSICRTIITAHQGEIWLEQNGPGGACFCFSLPHNPFL